MMDFNDPMLEASLRLGLIASVQIVLAVLVATPYLLPTGKQVPSRKRLLVGVLPLIVLGLAPAVVLLSVLFIQGPVFVYPAYGFLVVGLVAGLVGPLSVSGLRRRALFGVPALLAFAYWTLIPFSALASGMRVGLDTPIRFVGRLLT